METVREKTLMDMEKFLTFASKERSEIVCRTWAKKFLYSQTIDVTMDAPA